jgi:hypothetical protein
VKDPGIEIRTSLVTALGTLTYGGNNVPVYSDDPLSSVPDYFVKIGDITVTPDNQNNNKFNSSASVTIDIVTIQTGIISRDPADTIANTVINLITPNPGQVSLVGTNFQFISAWAESLGYLNGTQGDRQVVRKILTITFKIQEL